jgi:ABC-type Zn uptake system ZnuABC Zn-binding protein ZnuA
MIYNTMRKLLLLITFMSVLLGACTASPDSTSQPVRVLVSESFLGDITQNIAGERLTVDTLLQPGVDPHSFEPAPQDIAKISESQVLIVNGLGYETWLSKTLQNLGGQQSLVIASSGLTPKADPSGEHVDGDPHLWMNPLNVIRYVENIRDGLVAADPAGKQIYTKNAEAYIAQLKDLYQWIQTKVSEIPVEKRLLVTNHDSLGYLAQAYQFKMVGAVIPSVTSGAAPSARQMTELIDAIKQSEAKAIFLDIGENQALADQIASETGLKVVTDLYVETLSGPDGPAPTYLEMMKYDITQIVTALK